MDPEPQGSAGGWIVDVGEADFECEVVERSRRVPVVVDFWAPWCGPCRTLGPLLEELAREHAGAFVLARINVDECPLLAEQFGVRGIPAVVALRDAAIVGEFVGAQPRSFLQRFLAGLLPGEDDRQVRRGDERRAAGDVAAAEAEYRAVLARQPHHPHASLGLARVLAERGETAAALELLERVGPGGALADDAERLGAELRMRAPAGASEATLRARLADAPADLGARLALGRLLASERRYEEALEELLAAVRADPRFDDEAARRAMLDVFSVLGAHDPLVARFRAELARALYR